MDVVCSTLSLTQLLKFLDSPLILHKLKAIRAKDIAEIKLELSCKIPYVNIALPFPVQDFFSLLDSDIIRLLVTRNLNKHYFHSDKII